MKPVVGGESCHETSLYMLSGKLYKVELWRRKILVRVIGVIPPGHDGWNAGNEPVNCLEEKVRK
jgi:hypothetical protein